MGVASYSLCQRVLLLKIVGLRVAAPVSTCIQVWFYSCTTSLGGLLTACVLQYHPMWRNEAVFDLCQKEVRPSLRSSLLTCNPGHSCPGPLSCPDHAAAV